MASKMLSRGSLSILKHLCVCPPVFLSESLKKNEEVEQRLQDAANPSKHLQIQIPPRAPTHLSRYLRASQAGPALTLILKLKIM